MTRVSVIVPVGPDRRHLAVQLRALALQQTEHDFEVVVVDNTATPRQFDLPDERFRVVHASARSSIGYARNSGVRVARGELFLFCDADDEATSTWVQAMTDAAETADLVGGPLDESTLDPLSCAAETRPSIPLPRDLDLFPWFVGANIGINARALAAIGGWDEGYRGAEDIELCWRARLNGLSTAYATDALVRYRLRESAGAALRQGYTWGLAAPRLRRRFDFSGHGTSNVIGALRDWGLLTRSLVRAIRSRRDRRDWMRLFGLRAGRVVGSLRWRRLLL